MCHLLNTLLVAFLALCIMLCIPCATHHALHSLHYTSCFAFLALCVMLCIPCGAHHALHSLRCASCCAFLALCVMLCIPCATHHALHSLRCASCCAFLALCIVLFLACCALLALCIMLCIPCAMHHAVHSLTAWWRAESDDEQEASSVRQGPHRPKTFDSLAGSSKPMICSLSSTLACTSIVCTTSQLLSSTLACTSIACIDQPGALWATPACSFIVSSIVTSSSMEGGGEVLHHRSQPANSVDHRTKHASNETQFLLGSQQEPSKNKGQPWNQVAL
jgi:hypothetical protein